MSSVRIGPGSPLRRAVIAVAVGIMVAGCTATADSSSGPPRVAALQPVSVTRGDIVSVVTLEATTVASPAFAAVAPADGELMRGPLRNGAVVTRGQPLATVAGRRVISPADAVFEGWLVANGAHVVAHLPLAKLRYTGFAASAQAPASEAYRLASGVASARVQIKNGPGPATCEPVTPLGATTSSEASGEHVMAVLCLIDSTLDVFPGLGAVVGLRTAEKRNVMRLPVTAVAGAAEEGQVAKIVDGEPVHVDVELGITDGLYVEITSGLSEGDQVLRYGPNLWTGTVREGSAG
jgi:hypothetical protein